VENQPEPTKPPYGEHPVEKWVKNQLAAKDTVPAGPVEEPGDPLENPLLAHLANLATHDMAIAAAKNHDYAGGADPLANFRECERFGVDMASGIMVRLSDKWSRLTNLFGSDPALAKVADETLLDTVEDMRIYLGILHYVLSED